MNARLYYGTKPDIFVGFDMRKIRFSQYDAQRVWTKCAIVEMEIVEIRDSLEISPMTRLVATTALRSHAVTSCISLDQALLNTSIVLSK